MSASKALPLAFAAMDGAVPTSLIFCTNLHLGHTSHAVVQCKILALFGNRLSTM